MSKCKQATIIVTAAAAAIVVVIAKVAVTAIPTPPACGSAPLPASTKKLF
jgi:hypothetical protein